MTNRMKFWLGVSTAALLTGALPVIPAMMAPMTGSNLLVSDAEAQESGEGEGAATECATTEEGEGEEGGESECPQPEGEGGEDGEGEGG